MNVGEIFLQLSLAGNITKQISQEAQSASSAVKSSIGSMFKKAVSFAAITAAVVSMAKLGNSAIQTASDIQEVQNVVDTSFGSMAYKAEEFASTAINQFGMSELAAKKTASTYMAMSTGMGLASEEASNMSITMAGLTADVASFYNISQDLASIKLKAVWTGETEGLKDLGVVMTQTNLEQFALSQGINKSIKDMNQAEITTLRYNYVLDALKLASGDFAKTSGSWANQTRILAEQWKQLLSIWGTQLINVLTPAIQQLNIFMSKIIDISREVSNVFGITYDSALTNSANSTAAAISSTTDQIVSDTTSKLNGMRDFDLFHTISTSKTNDQSVSDIPTVISEDKTEDDGQNKGSTWAEAFVLKIKDYFKRFKMPKLDFGNIDIGPLLNNILDTLVFLWNDVLIPMGEWAVNNGLPVFIDALGKALGAVKDIAIVLMPVIKTFGSILAETILEVIVLIANGLTSISNWVNNNQTAAKILFGTVLGFMLAYKVAHFALTAATLIAKTATLINTAATESYAIITGQATVTTTAFSSALAFLAANPIVLIIAGIIALIAIIALLAFNWDFVKEKGTKAWEGIKNAWSNANEWMKNNVIDPLKTKFSEFFGSLKDKMIESVIQAVLRVINIFNGIISKINSATSFLNKNLGTDFGQIGTIGGNIPAYATGAVVAPNQPHLAIIGDSPKKEVITPEDLMRKIVREETATNKTTNQVPIVENYSIEIANEKIAQLTIDYANRQTKIKGSNVIRVKKK